MYYTTEVLSDIQSMVDSLTFEENQELLRCSLKMRNHLQKQVINGLKHYEQNIELLDMVIESHVNKSLESGLSNFLPLAS